MRYIKLINEYNAANLYQYYKDDIDKAAFDRITKVPKRTIYIKWLLNLYKNKKFKLEDIEKADKYISIFDKPNVYKELGGVKIIDTLGNIQELFKLIKPFYKVEYLDDKDKEEFIIKKCFKKEFKNFDLYIPTTHEESRWLGKGTQWCTAADSAESLGYFDSYTIDGNLYILISKTNPEVKYQIHIRQAQFMNLNDNPADDFDYNNNMDIIDYFMTENLDGIPYMGVEDIKSEEDDSTSEKLFQIFNIAYIYQYYSSDHLIYSCFDGMNVTHSYRIDSMDNDEDIFTMFNNLTEVTSETKITDITNDFLIQYENKIYVNSMLGKHLPKHDGYVYMDTTDDTTIQDLIEWLFSKN